MVGSSRLNMPILRDSMQAKFANIRRRTSGLRRSHTWTAADVRSDFQPDSRARPGAHRPGMGTVPEKGLTFFSLVRSGSVNSVKHLVKLFELKMVRVIWNRGCSMSWPYRFSFPNKFLKGIFEQFGACIFSVFCLLK